MIAFEALGVGLGTAAFIAFIARATDPRYTATQFALFTSLAAVPRTVVNASTGWVVEQTGWFAFFLICTVLALPGMALLLRVAPWNEPPRPRRRRGGQPMNRHKFSAIAHRDHDYCNPVAAAKIERLLDLLPLDAHSRVLDLGCGRGELALRIIERFGATVIAVDHSSHDARRRARARRVDRRAGQAAPRRRRHRARYEADPETFHLIVMLGAGGIAGGMAGICAKLKGWTRGRRLRPDRRGLLEAEAARPTTSRVLGGERERSTSTTAATCRRASTPG